MDTNRSEEREEASYSDDFEHDAESQDSRVSPFSEEKVEIKVFKSSVGSLTVQPKKIHKHAQMISAEDKSARTISELSLMAMKNRPPATANGTLGKCGSKIGNNDPTRCISVRMNQRSKTSLTTMNKPGMSMHTTKALAQEKIDPQDIQDIPASVAASVSSVSISRMSLRNRSALAYGRGAATNNIRRVAAHTSIKEKSYASAKYKTYHTPSGLRSNHPPLKVGLAKPNTNVAQRVASAKRMTIMDLKSKIKLLQDEIEKLKKENRFLNHLHHRQDNALRKWEGKDAELPRLLNQHKDEIRSLQEQLRRAQQNAREHNEKMAVRDKKIFRLENELEKLKSLVHEEHLQDRHTLQQDLDITRMNLAGAEKRIREYMRHVEILEKNHKHQLAAQERKFIKVNTHTYELQQVVANLKLALRNKDRMLNYIQMRSSGRTLIRAFHAERQDRGDDMLYGTSIQTELNRPYQPPPLPPLMKSHSFDFGNSRNTSPRLDEMRDYEFFGSRRFSDEHHHSKSKHYQKGGHSHDEICADRILSPRPLSRLSHSLESVARPRGSISPCETKGHSKSLARPTIKAHGSKELDRHSKTTSKIKGKGAVTEKSPRAAISKKKSKNSREENDVSARRHETTSHSKTSKKTLLKKVDDDKSKNSSKKVASNSAENAKVESAESRELIYKGSTKGFKYEGPFVSNNVGNEESRKADSTEYLYSPKSDKLSERSLSSTCTSHTVSSSRSEEIMSNIDILSARIRESCVNVPPPELELKKSTGVNSNTNSNSSIRNAVAESLGQNKLQFANNNKPSVGPAGDTPNSSSPIPQSIILAQMPSNIPQTNVESSILQPMQLVQQSNQLQPDIASPRSTQSFASPRMQVHTISLPSVTAMTPQTNYVPQVADQNASSELSVVTLNNGGIQYVSPRMNQRYTPVQTVSVISEPQHAIIHQSDLAQVTQLHTQQNQPSSSDYPYFTFTNSPVQGGIAPTPNTSNVTIYPTNNSSYSGSQHSYSPRISNGQFHTQPTLVMSPSARSSFARVSYANSGQSNTDQQSLPNINNNVGNKQVPYNPSYYVNLGSWK